ncbi:DNA replication and repair protein RecN [Cryptosporangium arvum DSM 44712]|uniref:DNA repair protein RecN n=1 Tax=Cryptosporangium arvum DSM 44712 TaxID=927661 RepID=A0A010YMD8_9ACTN|nr:DNA replication and repair protein RecN [Cryptosporangium arvum DSM 44712]
MGLGSLCHVLEEIRITGLGVIEDATLELVDGFTVVTGETGAGKTMVVAGLGLLFGGRADAGRVRRGSGRALVEGRLRFEPDDPAQKLVLDRVAEAGAAPDEDGTLLLARSVAAEGRSRAHVGGRTVPVGLLGELAEQMLAVHGQSDQLRLLSAAEQRAALDRYAGEEVTALREQTSRQYQAWRKTVGELTDRTNRAHERAQEADALRFGLTEIEAVNPLPGEDEELKAESQRLEHAEELRIAAYTAHQALAGDPTAEQESADVAALLGVVRRSLSAVAGHDAVLADAGRRADELAALCGELGTELASYTENLDADPARLAAVHERRAQLAGLTRKYSDSIDGVLAWAEQAAGKLADLDTSEEALDALRARRDELAAALAKSAVALSKARQAAATRFGEQVTAELTGLAMPHARVVAAVSQKDASEAAPSVEIDGRRLAVGPEGIDDVELRLASHPGAPELALHRGASGGELSRVMLAIEVVFAGAGGPPTMVFDEVDAGVGGRAAVEIGKRLARLARTHQVLVVTHLPQVAAFADHHVVVVKDSDGSVTTSGLRSLSATERPRELARMLAGLDDSDLGLAHAEELLAVAQAEKDAAA